MTSCTDLLKELGAGYKGIIAATHFAACVKALEAMCGEGPNLGHDHADVKFGHDPVQCRLCLAAADTDTALAALRRDLKAALEVK